MSPIMISEKEMSPLRTPFIYLKNYYFFQLVENLLSALFFFKIYRYENQLENFCKFMDPLLDSAPPESLQGLSSFKDRFNNRMHKSAFWACCLRQAMTLGQKDIV